MNDVITNDRDEVDVFLYRFFIVSTVDLCNVQLITKA